MTEQLTAARDAPTTASIRNELWELRHLVATLRVEIQRADDAYAALGVGLAAEQAERRRLTTELAIVTADLHDARAAHAHAAHAHADASDARDLLATENATVRRELDQATTSAREVNEQLGRVAAEREAWLQTRTVRWTRGPRKIWGWWLARRQP